MFPRRFALVRHIDYTGVSGVGVVAYGVVFHDGQVALRWCSDHPATSLWASVEDLLAVHGHGDATDVQWIDDTADRLHEIQASFEAPAPGRRARRGSSSPGPPTPEAPAEPPPAADPVPPVNEPPRQPPTAHRAAEPSNGTPAHEGPEMPSTVPTQRRSGGRHRRRPAPSEESAGHRQ